MKNQKRESGENRYSSSMLAPWRMSWVSIILFVLFATIIVGVALPPKLLDPSWQLALFSAVLNTAGFPLVGMGLLHLAADLDPTNEPLRNQRRLGVNAFKQRHLLRVEPTELED